MNRKKIESIVDSISRYHQRNYLFEAFSIVGSFANFPDKFQHDIDCLIVSRKKLPDSFIYTFVSSLSRGIRPIKLDDSFRVSINNIQFGLAYKPRDSFYREIENIIEGKSLAMVHKAWVIGGMIPEVLLTDISVAKILFDKSSRLINIQKELANRYPDNLRLNLTAELKHEFALRLKMIEPLLKEEDLLRFDLAIGELTVLLIRFIFCQNGIYLSPLKHLNDQLFKLSEDITILVDEVVNIYKSSNREKKLQKLKKVGLKIL